MMQKQIDKLCEMVDHSWAENSKFIAEAKRKKQFANLMPDFAKL